MYSFKKEEKLIQHNGIFKRQMSLWHAVAFIMSGTIGAGVLGLPYAIAHVGVGIGMIYIIALGILSMALNVMIGEVTVRTGGSFQLAGLARHYLGNTAGRLMTVITYTMWVGIMVVYIIGEGETLSALFQGTSVMWSLIFFIVMAVFVCVGVGLIQRIEFVLSFGIFLVVIVIALFGFPHINYDYVRYVNVAELLLPYGVVLFAFSGVSTIPEAHTLLRRRDVAFKHAIFIAGITVMILYALFAYVVVGVTGSDTTEVATIGLGQRIGPVMFMLGNMFAMFAMATSFLMTALSFRDSLRWDYKFGMGKALLTVLSLPLIIFLLGVREFIMAIDIVGGVIVSMQLIMMSLVYWRAKQVNHLKKSTYNLHHTWWLVVLLLLAFTIGAVYSVWKIF